jgi:hypothetical protein
MTSGGGQWTLTLDGDRAVVPDRVGMRYLTTLLRNPGVDAPAVELAGSTAFVSCVGAPPRDRTSAGGGSVRNRAGKLLSRPFRRRGRSSARWPLRTPNRVGCYES